MHTRLCARPWLSQVFKEMHRVLKPGGSAYMSFSNRCFPTKAIGIWTKVGDPDHVRWMGEGGLRACCCRPPHVLCRCTHAQSVPVPPARLALRWTLPRRCGLLDPTSTSLAAGPPPNVLTSRPTRAGAIPCMWCLPRRSREVLSRLRGDTMRRRHVSLRPWARLLSAPVVAAQHQHNSYTVWA